MRKLFLAAAIGLLLTACSTTNLSRHEGKDTFPPETKELAPVNRQVARVPFSVESVAKAVEEQKVIILYFNSPYCHFCNKMDKDVWSHPEIARIVNKAYSFLEVDISASPENLGMFLKYTEMLGVDKGVPLTVLVFPRISPEDQSLMPMVVPTNLDEVDALFASTLSLNWSGYVSAEEIYPDLLKLGILYNKKLDEVAE